MLGYRQQRLLQHGRIGLQLIRKKAAYQWFSSSAAVCNEATASGPAVAEKSKVAVEAAKVVDDDPEKSTGEIDKHQGEFLLYFNRLFIPSGQFGRFIPSFLYRRSNQSVLNSIISHLPADVPVELVEFIPREREGGAFAKFRTAGPKYSAVQAQNRIIDHIHAEQAPSWFHWKVFPVMGKPWIEDMRRAFTRTVRVTFDGPDVKPEDLYSTLRRYGRINDITPPAPGTKDLPRSTLVNYGSYVDATAARNCANGQQIDDTTIHISFVISNTSTNPIKDWIVGHPRVSVPIIIAILAGLTFFIFEPIRVFSVESKVRGTAFEGRLKFLSVWKHRIDQWRSTFSWSRKSHEENLDIFLSWRELAEESEGLNQLLKEGTDTFIIVTGPRGSGKSRLVRAALRDSARPVLQVDCEALDRAKSGNSFLSGLSGMIGYYPVFLWMNNISKFVDLAVQSLMAGQSTGFSETVEQQSRRMLDTAALAIHNVAVEGKPKDMKDSDYLQAHPDTKPVIILRGFSSTDQRSAKLLAEWAGGLVSSNIAQVIFVTQDMGSDKMLSEALPNRVFESIKVADASAEAAKRYVLNYIRKSRGDTDSKNEKSDKSGNDLPSAAEIALRELEALPSSELEPLGGRLNDLQAFTRRIIAAETPLEALSDMIDQSAIEIAQVYLNAKNDDWTTEQVWTIVRFLAKLKNDKQWLPVSGGLSGSPLFSSESSIKALRALEHREMISGHNVGGRLTDIRPGKPLYYAAFKRMVEDPILCAIMDSSVIKALISSEESKIKTFEQELEVLAKLPRRWETSKRQDYLSTKLAASQTKIDDLDRDMKTRQADLKKALSDRERT